MLAGINYTRHVFSVSDSVVGEGKRKEEEEGEEGEIRNHSEFIVKSWVCGIVEPDKNCQDSVC